MRDLLLNKVDKVNKVVKELETLYTQISRALLRIISDCAGQIKYFFMFEDIYCIKIRDAPGKIIRYLVHL